MTTPSTPPSAQQPFDVKVALDLVRLKLPGAADVLSAALSDAVKRATEAERERDAWKLDWQNANHSCIEHLQTLGDMRDFLAKVRGELSASETARRELEKALEPFANIGDLYPDALSGDTQAYVALTHLRDARRALCSPSTSGKNT